MELVRGVYRTGSSGRARPSPALAANGGLTPNGGSSDSRDVFHVSFDPDEESIVEVVTNAVAVIHNEEPTELDPLHEVVDVDALEELVAPSGDDRPGADEVEFVYEGLAVVVDADGDVWLRWE